MLNFYYREAASRPSISGRSIQLRLPAPTLNSQRGLSHVLLAQGGGRVYGPDGAAASLGVAPSTLDSRIRRLAIDKFAFRRRVPTRLPCGPA